jgi:hypothetical protein
MNCVIAIICILVLGVNFPGFLNTSLQRVPDAFFFVCLFILKTSLQRVPDASHRPLCVCGARHELLPGISNVLLTSC